MSFTGTFYHVPIIIKLLDPGKFHPINVKKSNIKADKSRAYDNSWTQVTKWSISACLFCLSWQLVSCSCEFFPQFNSSFTDSSQILLVRDGILYLFVQHIKFTFKPENSPCIGMDDGQCIMISIRSNDLPVDQDAKLYLNGDKLTFKSIRPH